MDDTELTRLLERYYRTATVDIDDLLARFKQRQRIVRRRWCTAMAASVVLLAALFAYFAAIPQVYVTTATQQAFELQDGSVAELDAHSRLRVAYSMYARNLYFEQGQVRFKVRHNDRRRFRVHTDLAVAEAMGTQFDVRIAHGVEVIAVIEGTVKLHPNPAAIKAPAQAVALATPVELPAGQSATVRSDRVPEVHRIDVAAITGWARSTKPLEFKDRPLAEIAGVFNHNNAAPKIRIEGDDLRARHFAFSFDDANAKTLLEYLGDYDDLEFVRNGEDVIVRERKR